MPQASSRTHQGLSQVTARNRDIAIFRRFSTLNNLNLIYYQAQLVRLEADLRSATEDDNGSADPKRQIYARDYDELAASGDDCDSLQWELVLEMRQVLKQYNKALLQQLVLSKHPAPSENKLQALRDWLHFPTDGGCSLRGLDALVWDRETPSELVVLDATPHEDSLTRWLQTRFAAWWLRTFRDLRKRSKVSDLEKGSVLVEYSDRGYSVLAAVLSSIISALILTSSIFILYFVRDQLARLLVVAAFTLLFSLCLTLVMQAKKADMFAATAAFAAVLVVFVSNSSTPS